MKRHRPELIEQDEGGGWHSAFFYCLFLLIVAVMTGVAADVYQLIERLT